MLGKALLQGIVGSTAYGFAHEGSDVDRLGVYAVPTEDLFGLNRPKESYVTTDPDYTWHEIAKWCRLALKCNPTAMELVWLADDLYETITPSGRELIGMRNAFLSYQCVRSAYLGYATQQLVKMKSWKVKMDNREDHDSIHAKRLKHARHVVRLLVQAQELNADRNLVIRLPKPDWVWGIAEEMVADPTLGDSLLRAAEREFDGPTALPELPQVELIENWLRQTRRELMGTAHDFIDAL